MAGVTERARVSVWIALVLLLALAAPADARKLRVVATLPGLADLTREVGGDEVDVQALVRGAEDPHFVEARPSFIRLLSRADLFVYAGLSLELGWVPPLLRNARNAKVLPGGSGDFDASRGIPLRDVMTGRVDRSMGDVHPDGNPHYLLDPVNGLRVAMRLRDVLATLRPEAAEAFAARFADFERRLLAGLFGDSWLARQGAASLSRQVLEPGFVLPSDAEGGPRPEGWAGRLAPYHGASVIADHNLWSYFAGRFELRVAGFLEPVPGITPTTSHLTKLAARMKLEGISVILSAAYFHSRYASKLAQASGGRVVEMANQVGAREGVDDYLEMIDWNVRKLSDAFDGFSPHHGEDHKERHERGHEEGHERGH